jgi:regulatory protein
MDSVKAIRRAAMNTLARREHTRKELEQKLLLKFPQEKEQISSVIAQLCAEGLQSDRRFAEGYIRWRANKGYGPVRIGMELAQKGVAEELLDDAINTCGIDWLHLLVQQFAKKYDSQKPATIEDKAKIHRFFQYRGFSSEQIKSLLI